MEICKKKRGMILLFPIMADLLGSCPRFFNGTSEYIFTTTLEKIAKANKPIDSIIALNSWFVKTIKVNLPTCKN